MSSSTSSATIGMRGLVRTLGSAKAALREAGQRRLELGAVDAQPRERVGHADGVQQPLHRSEQALAALGLAVASEP